MQNQESQTGGGLFDTGTSMDNQTRNNSLSGYTYAYDYPNWRWVDCRTPPPIELKLSEIELLRDLVRDQKKARKILNKFSGHIKVEVDF